MSHNTKKFLFKKIDQELILKDLQKTCDDVLKSIAEHNECSYKFKHFKIVSAHSNPWIAIYDFNHKFVEFLQKEKIGCMHKNGMGGPYYALSYNDIMKDGYDKQIKEIVFQNERYSQYREIIAGKAMDMGGIVEIKTYIIAMICEKMNDIYGIECE